MKEKMVLFNETISLDEHLAIKNKLNERQIFYKETIGNPGGNGDFLAKLFTGNRAGFGMSGEHQQIYCLYVKKEDEGICL